MRTRFPSPQADDCFVVQPSDSVLLVDDSNNVNDYPIATLYYGGAAAADIAVVMANSPGASPVTITFGNVQPGTYMPIVVRQVKATGTTAAAGTIIALVGRMGFQ